MSKDEQGTEIVTFIPVETRFVNLARVMAASLAADQDFSYDDVEDVRLATNELVSSLMDWGIDHGGSRLRLGFSLTGDELALHAEVEGAEASTDENSVDELAQRILGSVADSFEIAGSSGWVRKLKSTS